MSDEFRSAEPTADAIIAEALVEEAQTRLLRIADAIPAGDPLLGDALEPAADAATVCRTVIEGIRELRAALARATTAEVLRQSGFEEARSLTVLDGGAST